MTNLAVIHDEPLLSKLDSSHQGGVVRPA